MTLQSKFLCGVIMGGCSCQDNGAPMLVEQGEIVIE